MSKNRTRKSISVKGTTYVRAQRAAEVLGCSISEVAERGLNHIAAMAGVGEVQPSEVPRPEPRAKAEDFNGSHFTF